MIICLSILNLFIYPHNRYIHLKTLYSSFNVQKMIDEDHKIPS